MTTANALRKLLSVLALALSAACASETVPTTPTPTPAPPGPGPVAYTPEWPAIDRPGRIYIGESTPFYPIHRSLLFSRYVLYDDRTFALQNSSINYPFFEYRGTYTQTNDTIVFTWEGWSTAGPWGATATVTDDTLDVKYNLIMQMTDFEDGRYLRER
jgi:hypothetical protein